MVMKLCPFTLFLEFRAHLESGQCFSGKNKAPGKKIHRCGPNSAQSLNDSPAFSGLSLPICKMRGRHQGPAGSYTPWFCDAKWSLKPKAPFLSVLCNSTSEHSIHQQESPPVPTSMSVTVENIRGGENASPVLRESKPRMKTQQTAPETPERSPAAELMQAAGSAIPDCSWTSSLPWTAGGAGEWRRWTAARVSRRCCQGLTRVMTGEGSTAHRPRGASHSHWFSLKACALFPVTPFLESAHPADFLADSLGW